MTSKEMEARSGVARANLRYYEAEGLLTPQRLKNGYRTYSEADLAVLEKIKLLRRLGVSIEALRGLRRGSADLSAVLDRRLAELETEQATLFRVRQVCGDLRAEEPTFETLEPEKYLEALDAPAPQSSPQPTAPPLPAADVLPVVTNLWRRLAARTLDEFFLVFLILTVLALLGKNPAKFSDAGLFGSVVLAVLHLLLEPLLLHFFATTPGKALLGMRITRRNGERLSYGAGVARHLRMLWEALGLGIPIWSWIQLYKCCKRWSQEEPQPWDEGLAYTARPFQARRHLAGPALACLAVLAAGEAANSFSQLPPHRGDLTVAEFAENYNRQSAYIYDSSRHYLDQEGRWQERPDPPGAVSIPLFGGWQREEISYTLDGETVAAVTLEYAIENTDQWMSLPTTAVAVTVSSLAWARPEASFWSVLRKPLMEDLSAARYDQNFTLQGSGATITWEITQRNFDVFANGELAIPEQETDNFLAVRCTVAVG